jgi:predicted nuclease of predicted toxin-antitoxin system
MKFLADESCDCAIVRALRVAGYDVKEVRVASIGAPDEKVINMALQESRVLLTEDKDFGQLVFASAVKSPGVILLRYPADTRRKLARVIVEFVEKNTEKIEGRFTVIQPGRIRISE